MEIFKFCHPRFTRGSRATCSVGGFGPGSPLKAGMTILGLLALLSACAPQEQDYNPSPQGQAQLDATLYHASDDAVLPYRSWLPAKKPKAIIIALHGFNDYSRAFDDLGEFSKSRGVAVYAYDQRGFGGTANIGIWASEENLVGDLKQFVQQVKSTHPRVPVYILGESMGGAVAITALADPDFPKVQGLILSAPAVWGAETMNPIYRSTLWLAAHTIPFREFTGSDLKILASNNIPMLRRLVHDPLVIKKTRVDAVYGVVHLMDSAYTKIPEIHTPTLLLYGAQDQVIPRDPIKSAITRFTEPVEYAYYPDGYHMLLRDLEREEVMADVLSWMRHPRAPLPSGYGTLHTPSQTEAVDMPVYEVAMH